MRKDQRREDQNSDDTNENPAPAFLHFRNTPMRGSSEIYLMESDGRHPIGIGPDLIHHKQNKND